jgi:opine dehydrogenase
MTNISVLGAGHGGKAMAAYLGILSQYKKEIGGKDTLEVRLWNRSMPNIQPLKVAAEQAGIIEEGLIRLLYKPEKEEEIFRNALFPDLSYIQEKNFPVNHINEEFYKGDLKDLTSIFSHITIVTTSLSKALDNSDIIMVSLPATAHEETLSRIIPELKKNPEKKQYIVLNPGRTMGALLAHNMFLDAGLNPKTKIPVEAETFVYASRSWNGSSYILGSKNVVEVAAIPHAETQEFVELIRGIYNQFTKAENGAFDTSGNNVAVIFHAGLMGIGAPLIMEAIRDRRKGKIYEKEYYCSLGTNPLIALQLEQLDFERTEIYKELGKSRDWKIPSATEWLKSHYGVSGTSLAQVLSENTAYHGLLYPHGFDHRYYVEDGRHSFVPTFELGNQLNLELPGFKRLNELMKLYIPETKIDVFANSRTLEKIGISGYSAEKILDVLIDGKI